MAMGDTAVKLIASVGVAWFAIQQITATDPVVRIGIPLAAGLITLWLVGWFLDMVDED